MQTAADEGGRVLDCAGVPLLSVEGPGRSCCRWAPDAGCPGLLKIHLSNSGSKGVPLYPVGPKRLERSSGEAQLTAAVLGNQRVAGTSATRQGLRHPEPGSDHALVVERPTEQPILTPSLAQALFVVVSKANRDVIAGNCHSEDLSSKAS